MSESHGSGPAARGDIQQQCDVARNEDEYWSF